MFGRPPGGLNSPVPRLGLAGWLGFGALNRTLMLWALLAGSVIGLGEPIAATASPSWAESVGHHWTGLLPMPWSALLLCRAVRPGARQLEIETGLGARLV